jgi:hypothetical protein
MLYPISIQLIKDPLRCKQYLRGKSDFAHPRYNCLKGVSSLEHVLKRSADPYNEKGDYLP